MKPTHPHPTGPTPSLFPLPHAVLLAWLGVALVALLTRLAFLDRAPLDTQEARYDLSAWHAAQGSAGRGPADLEAPLFSHVMVAVFWLFGASDAAARLLPAVAGAAWATAPFLLAPTLGTRMALAAGALIATSPLAVEASRRADPASLTGLLVVIAAASAIRAAADRPTWVPWLLAGSLGATLAHHSAALLALGLAAAATAVGRPSSVPPSLSLFAPARVETFRRPILFGAVVAAMAATGALTDLRGIGFLAGDVWAGALARLAPASFSVLNLLALGAYAGPVVVLAAIHGGLAIRERRPLERWLVLWTVFLLAAAAIAPDASLSAIALPLVPATLLAGGAIARLPWEPSAYRMGARIAILSAVGVYLMMAASGVGRVSFGGSPPGSEPLRAEEIDTRVRDLFSELTLSASLDPRQRLIVESGPTEIIRWYGRAIREDPAGDAPGPTIAFRQAPGGAGQLAPGGTRLPIRVRSFLEPTDLHPLGIARWALSRGALMKGRAEEIVVTRSGG